MDLDTNRFEYLELKIEESIAWLILNRPKAMNALNSQLLKEIQIACQTLSVNRDVRILVITGFGCKIFCAGADLAERKGFTEGQVLDYISLIQSTMLIIEQMPQPVIAAINGSAFGGGTELTLACDLRIMSQDAVLRLTEVNLGIIPGAGGTQRLSRLIGKSRAKEIILTARPVSAEEALNFGLVHRIVEAAEDKSVDSHTKLIEATKVWAQEIIKAAPLSLKQAKYAIDNGYDRDLMSGLALETKAYIQLLNTKDRLEGLAAFAEKREAVYRGE